MLSKQLLNGLLLIILVTLAVTIMNTEQDTAELPRLTDLDSKQIRQIRIEHHERTSQIDRTPSGSWRFSRPVDIAANNFRINSLLKLLQAPVHASYAANEIDLTAAGLKDPVTTIQFDNIKLLFGKVNPATGLRYVRMQDRIYTIEDVYYPLLSSHFSSLVSLNLVPEHTDLKKLVLVSLTISKDSNGVWTNNDGRDADASAKIIDDWRSAQAFGIHEYMQRENHGAVTLETGNNKTIRYQVTDKEPWLILARPELGIEYHLEKEDYKRLIEP
jgi:hypothetical protein